jgi:hypothetical protein
MIGWKKFILSLTRKIERSKTHGTRLKEKSEKQLERRRKQTRI